MRFNHVKLLVYFQYSPGKNVLKLIKESFLWQNETELAAVEQTVQL